MFKRSLIILAASGLFAGVSAPVFADNSIGFDPDYVLNPNGKEVAQTNASASDSLGFDPWYVAGSFEQKSDTQIAGDEGQSDPSRENVQLGHAYADPAFGQQADA
jgi:hypothetical protein